MNFNINRVTIHEIDCWTTGMMARKLYVEFKDRLPESNLFDHIDLLGTLDEDVITIDNLDWNGVSSGTSYNDVFIGILSKICGSAKFSIAFEDGSIEYYKLSDGEVKLVNHVRSVVMADVRPVVMAVIKGEFPRLHDVLCGNPLWDITLPIDDQKTEMLKVREEIEREWEEHLNRKYSNINTGILVGALNIINGLLGGKVNEG